jgi:steroid delta-isomerase-like uncharacterized protein
MSEQDNINSVRMLFDALNKHDISTFEKYLGDDFKGTMTDRPGEMNKLQEIDFIRQLLQTFPDLHFDLKDVVAQGEKVAVTWVQRGTNKGPIPTPTGETLPATNRTINSPGSIFFELRNGKIIRQGVYLDNLVLNTQLGLTMPMQTSAATRK